MLNFFLFMQGRRTKKNRTRYKYDSRGRLIKQGSIEFYYDTTGLAGLKYNNGYYTYRKDIQGNIIAILDSTGKNVVEYRYDAWGNHRVVDEYGNEITEPDNIGQLNPFRYRGYYYDKEFKLYYLKTRYYCPALCRFINADNINYADPEKINGLNLYAYCGNNPVMYVDPTGQSWESFWNGVCNWFEKHWVEVLVGTLLIIGGAIVSALTCGVGTSAWAAFGSALLSSAIQVGASVAVGVGVNGLVNLSNGNNFFYNVGDAIASAYMWGGIFSGGSQMLSGGARFLRAKIGFKGINSNHFGFMSPDKLYHKQAGMTLFRIGSKDGIKLAIDLGRYGIHAHFFSNLHTPLIPFLVGLIEVF